MATTACASSSYHSYRDHSPAHHHITTTTTTVTTTTRHSHHSASTSHGHGGGHGHSHGGGHGHSHGHGHGGHSHRDHHHSAAVAPPPPASPQTHGLNLDVSPSSLPYDEATLNRFIKQLSTAAAAVASPQIAKQRIEGLRGIRKLTCADRTPPLQQVIDSGVLPEIIAALHDDDPFAQFESSWILTNIASGTQNHAKTIASSLPRLVQLLSSPYHDIQEQAIWTLGNYVGSNHVMRDQVIELGIIDPLLEIMKPSTSKSSSALPNAAAAAAAKTLSPSSAAAAAAALASASPATKLSVLRVAAWCLSNLTRGKPAVEFSSVQKCLPILSDLLHHSTDEAVLVDVLWSASFLTDDLSATSEKLDHVIAVPGMVARIVALLKHSAFSIQSAALRCVGNIASGTDVHTQHLLEADALSALLYCMVSPKKVLRKESCWALSNVSAGNNSHVTSIIESGMIPPLVRILEHDSFVIQKEVAWCLSNITSNGSYTQLQMFLYPPLDVTQPLMELLNCPGANDSINHIVLVTILNLLRVGQHTVVQQQFEALKCDQAQSAQWLEAHPNATAAETAAFCKANGLLPPNSSSSTSPSSSSSAHQLPSTSSHSSAPAVNPVISQVYAGGGPKAIAAVQIGRNADSALLKCSQEILEEFFPKYLENEEKRRKASQQQASVITSPSTATPTTITTNPTNGTSTKHSSSIEMPD